MEECLLVLSSSKTFMKMRTKRYVKVSLAIASILAAVVMWDVYPNFKHVIVHERQANYGRWPYIMAMLMLYSYLLSMVGISVLGNLIFELSTPIQLATAASLQGYGDHEERKTNYKIISRMFGTVIMMIVLLWATCSGLNLATRLRKESKFYALAISIGVAIVAFGLIYFIIGVVIFIKLAKGLLGALPTKCENESKEVHAHQHSSTGATNVV